MKKFVGLLLTAVMLCCSFYTPASSMAEEDYQEWLAEREEKAMEILEKCGMTKENATQYEFYEGNENGSDSLFLTGNHLVELSLQVPGGLKWITWEFEHVREDLIYTIYRYTEELAQELQISIQVEGSDRFYDWPDLRYIDLFNYESEYELEHGLLKPLTTWSEFRNIYNSVVQSHYEEASGRIVTKLDIPDKGISTVPGDLYDTMDIEFANKKFKYSIYMTVWLEHDTENVCRILISFPYREGNDTIFDNERRSAISAVMEAACGWDYSTSDKNLRLFKGASNSTFKRYYEQDEEDGFLVRIVNDQYDEQYMKAYDKNPTIYYFAGCFLIQGQ